MNYKVVLVVLVASIYKNRLYWDKIGFRYLYSMCCLVACATQYYSHKFGE